MKHAATLAAGVLLRLHVAGAAAVADAVSAAVRPVSNMLTCSMFKMQPCGSGCTLGPCEYDHVPIDCKGEWSEWSECDVGCDPPGGLGGNHTRAYRVVVPSSKGGLNSTCLAAHGAEEMQSCSNGPCPVDCVGNWGAWTNCSVECGDGVRDRAYNVTTEAVHGGSLYTCTPPDNRTGQIPCNLGDCVGVAPCLLDMCGTCDYNITNDCQQDCGGEWGGPRLVDKCEVCGGTDECLDCSGEAFGFKYADKCGSCDEDSANDCVADCEGTYGGLAIVDECTVCGGDNTSCKKTHTKVAAAAALAGGVSAGEPAPPPTGRLQLY